MALTNDDLRVIINEEFAAIPVQGRPYRPIAGGLIEMGRKYLGPVHDYPISLACAIAEQETWGRNIFGCDAGSMFCQEMVTRERVDRLISGVRAGRFYSNGVGIGQPTFFPLLEEMERLGGADIPRNQMIVCFSMLAGLIRSYGYHGGIGAYNAGWAGRWEVRWTYTADVERLHEWWIGKLS